MTTDSGHVYNVTRFINSSIIINNILLFVDIAASMIMLSTGTSLPQRWMLLFTQGLTGVFRQADETFN
jgi:hypothetical protein